VLPGVRVLYHEAFIPAEQLGTFSSMVKVGLVLGAGGTVGQAYHAGVLAALEHDLGWDPRTAEVVVGSSAGSVTGTLLRLGVPASDLAAYAVESPLSLEGSRVYDQVSLDPSEWPPLSFHMLWGRWRPPPPALLTRTFRHPRGFRPVAALASLMPKGRIDLQAVARQLEGVVGDGWPADLWVCAVRRSDGKRVVFGRPRPRHPVPPPVADAVAASCAIPGYFSPVRINGIDYIDGGVHSPTNADVLAERHLDVVIVVSPMSSHRWHPAPDVAIRWSAHRRLERECQQLRRKKTDVVCFEPGHRSTAAMGINAMATDRADRVVQSAFLEAGHYVAFGEKARVLDRLATRKRGSTTSSQADVA
jgi:NTE family protein